MKHKTSGFTLLEILIALFIFTIVSFILSSALHNVINITTHTENKRERLRQLQITLLLLSRDIEQAVNRPVLNPDGKEEAAFIGDAQGFALTRMGFANTNNAMISNLQRIHYTMRDQKIVRMVWPVLDAAPTTKPVSRTLMPIDAAYIEYLDNMNKFHNAWPIAENKNNVLPRAVRIHFTIKNWGKISQLFVINAATGDTPNGTSQ